MQFSTIFSIAALVASVVAAPASCETQATQTSTINCANTPGYNVAQCYINGQFLPYEGSLCSVIQTVTTATAMCCSSQQQGYININIAPCVKAL